MSNRLLGGLFIVFAWVAITNIVLFPISGTLLHEALTFFRTAHLYFPLTFLYIWSNIRILNSSDLVKHLLIPLLFLIISPFENLSSIYEFGLLALFIFYSAASIYLILKKNLWAVTVNQVRVRVISFFVIVQSYYTFTAFKHFILYNFFSENVEFIRSFSHVDSILFAFIFFSAPFYGILSLNRVRKFILPASTSIDTQNKNHLDSSINKVFDKDHAHRDPAFNKDTLIRFVEVEEKEVVLYFKAIHDTTISNYINYKRINCFKEEILKPENKNLDIFGVASKCGFNSRASFYRAFKQFENCTPTEYVHKSKD
jgi:AraC-like DNA-binding protein